jgi:hypothetical protein
MKRNYEAVNLLYADRAEALPPKPPRAPWHERIISKTDLLLIAIERSFCNACADLWPYLRCFIIIGLWVTLAGILGKSLPVSDKIEEPPPEAVDCFGPL